MPLFLSPLFFNFLIEGHHRCLLPWSSEVPLIASCNGALDFSDLAKRNQNGKAAILDVGQRSRDLAAPTINASDRQPPRHGKMGERNYWAGPVAVFVPG